MRQAFLVPAEGELIAVVAPVMVVDDTYYGKMTMEKLPGVIESYRKEG